MKLNLTHPTLLMCSTVFALGCGKSPLLNHADASSGATGTHNPVLPRSDEERATCPLLFPKAALCASISWDKQPGSEDAASFTLRYWNRESGSANGPYVDPASTVGVKLWMTAMGHGSSPVNVAHDVDPGVFKATNVYFVMPGEWDIHVQLKNGAKVVEEAVEKVTI